MRLKNEISGLEKRNGVRLFKRLYLLCLDSKLCSLFSSLLHQAHCFNIPLKGLYPPGFFPPPFLNLGRQASKEKHFNISLSFVMCQRMCLCTLHFNSQNPVRVVDEGTGNSLMEVM